VAALLNAQRVISAAMPVKDAHIGWRYGGSMARAPSSALSFSEHPGGLRDVVEAKLPAPPSVASMSCPGEPHDPRDALVSDVGPSALARLAEKLTKR
jgi:hypothetical protein